MSFAIYVPPLTERVPAAQLIVLGTITLEKTVDGWNHGHVTVTRMLKGEAAAGAKLPARWKAPPPKPGDPAAPRLADYTFVPAVGAPQIVLLFPKKEGEKVFTLNWGSTEPPANEPAVKAALGAPRAR